MLSVIIATDAAEQPVVATLAALVPGATAGLISEVVLADRTGSAAIERVADIAGCTYLPVDGSHAAALAAGASQARSSWLMFLHPGAIPDQGWIEETTQFIQGIAVHGAPRAAIFRYARSPYAPAGLREGLRSAMRLLSGPSADQGLLIARAHYEKLGGHPQTSHRPEQKLLAHLGRSGRALLRTRIFVPARASGN